MRIYKNLNAIPTGHSDPEKLYPGCLVLEGGAFRGLYTQGALDALLKNDINIQTTIGVSAGAMGGFSYVAGQIGRSARLNLHYRHNPDYVGVGAMRRDRGITGFSFAFDTAEREEPLDRKTFNDPKRRFVAVATDIQTGKPVYFEKGNCSDIMKAIQASATVPYISEPVEIDRHLYLDGGCSVHIPVDWAVDQGFDKILVIRTRERSYRKPERKADRLTEFKYRDYPALVRALKGENAEYNALLDRIDNLEKQGRIMVLAPERPVEISRFEGNMKKLGALYWEGYFETSRRMPEIRRYFGVCAGKDPES